MKTIFKICRVRPPTMNTATAKNNRRIKKPTRVHKNMWVDVRRELWIAVYNIKKNQWRNGNDYVYDFEYFYEQLERRKEWEMEERGAAELDMPKINK